MPTIVELKVFDSTLKPSKSLNLLASRSFAGPLKHKSTQSTLQSHSLGVNCSRPIKLNKELGPYTQFDVLNCELRGQHRSQQKLIDQKSAHPPTDESALHLNHERHVPHIDFNNFLFLCSPRHLPFDLTPQSTSKHPAVEAV